MNLLPAEDGDLPRRPRCDRARPERAPRPRLALAVLIAMLGSMIFIVPATTAHAASRNSLGAARSEQQDRAWTAVREGRHVPLLLPVAKLRRRFGGHELDAGLERWNHRTVYRIRWTAHGRRDDFYADARTGHILGRTPNG